MWRLTFPVLGANFIRSSSILLGKLSSFAHPPYPTDSAVHSFQTGLLALGDLPDLFRC